MYRVLFFWLCLAASATAELVDSNIWINELHYDNDGADTQEFVEIAAPLSFSELSRISLTLYNGSNGSAYSGPVTLDEFTLGSTSGHFRFFWHELSMQNGGPDGMALADDTTVLAFLSYEGTFQATDGVAQGLLSTDIGVMEPTTTPAGSSLQLQGYGDSASDFTWQTPGFHTLGLVNSNQTVVPEPTSVALCLAGILPLVVLWRFRRWRDSPVSGGIASAA